MAINYEEVARTPYVFRELVEMAVDEFEKLVEKTRPEWEKVKKKEMPWKKISCSKTGR